MDIADDAEAMWQEAIITFIKETTSLHSAGVTHTSKKNSTKLVFPVTNCFLKAN
jgi:hypothetical protein